MTYETLEPYAFYFHASKAKDMKSQDHGGSRSIPGRFGARAAKLIDYLDSSHYDVSLTPEEFHRVTLWLDANSMNMEDYVEETPLDDTTVYWPIWDVDPGNPTGVESAVAARGPINGSRMDSSPRILFHVRRGVVRIQTPGPGAYTVGIRNLQGRTIYEKTFQTTGGLRRITWPRSATGMYVLHLTGNGVNQVRKLVIQ
jgi:hypothetical protein